MKIISPGHYQSGSVNLLIALVLSMSVTLVTLAVARTQMTEQRIAANSHWHTRLSLEAQSSWNFAAEVVSNRFDTLSWMPNEVGVSAEVKPPWQTDDSDIVTIARLQRVNDQSHWIDLEAIAMRNDGSKQQAVYRQSLRLLNVLTPFAKSPPPLILNGCQLSSTTGIEIYPKNSDTAVAGPAYWRSGKQACTESVAVDIHAGQVLDDPASEPLWSTIFSISPDAYTVLSKDEQALPEQERRYWLVTPTGSGQLQWDKSLGSLEKPVTLVFPPETGCPQFSAGVQIVGVVYIATDCNEPVTSMRLEIVGTLVVNGNLDAGDANINLSHIQAVDDTFQVLDYPVLRAVKVPGSWMDFD